MVLASSFFSFSANAQFQIPDTLKVMSYNLTNYGNTVPGCTTDNNGLAIKNPEFKTILKHVMPDILGACEFNTNPTVIGSFLNNVLNTDGVNWYQRSNTQPEPSGTLTSVLFYNNRKLVLHSQSYAPTAVRLVHHFRLYLKTTGLLTGDTIWVNVLAGHLKAGNGTADQTTRGEMAAAVRSYLNTFSKKESCMIMGDFNVYKSSETAWINLTAPNPNPTYQFIDPVNRVGSWTNNSSFSDVHSQCPSINLNGCFSGGGLDDRFDFILMNRHLLNDSGGLKYMPGTYRALGNDGQHYNKNITDSPTNTSAPSAVIQSLYKASDHLPIICRLAVDGTFISASKNLVNILEINGFINENTLHLVGLPDGFLSTFNLWNTAGQQVFSGNGNSENGECLLQLPVLANGLYFGNGFMADGRPIRIKVVAQQ